MTIAASGGDRGGGATRAGSVRSHAAPIESLIKQIYHRVKDAEMTWNAPHGAEAILRVRAASRSEDGRLDHYRRHRPGHPLTRRPQPATA